MTLPLRDIKIADFSWVGAGPRATKDLADLGAEVIKIESRKRLDLGRMSPPFAGGKRDIDGSAFFAITNTSKQSVAINLAEPAGVDLAKKLVARADVVVENFSAGFMERIGLSFEELKAIKPDIILISVSVAGRTGPLGKIRGYGNSAAALSGLASMSGWPDRDPHMPPFAYGDVVAPMFATVATLAALEHKRKTGRGQHIDISQVEPLIHTLADSYAAIQKGKPVKQANASSTALLQDVFACRGKDQYVAVTLSTQQQLLAAADLLDIAQTKDLSPETVKDALSCYCQTADKHAVAKRFKQAGIAAEAVADGRDVYTDEALQHGHYRWITHSKLGLCDMPAPPLRFSESSDRVTAPPCLGENLQDVFVSMLGEDPAHISKLVDAGILA
ncbi:CoA transferase [Alteromonas sp. NFXS44]|uniref:CaiB/BaiF CoA transferase family protein n=1 Tax=Alteromonas sp. NFXS44 TaxID=2818435 RepID=UPI0032DE6DFA